MNIFGIFGLSALIGVLVLAINMLVILTIPSLEDRFDEIWVTAVSIPAVVVVLSTIIGIGLYTDSEQIYVEQYNIQKQTIEAGIDAELLSGFERVELVNEAVRLNGEMAERKARLARWYYVTFDESIYDNVEPIMFE